MSYTPPNGSNTDFTFAGVAYTAPNGNNVDFTFLVAQQAQGFQSTQFGSPVGRYNQTVAVTAAAPSTAHGTHAGSQYSPVVATNSTAFGTPLGVFNRFLGATGWVASVIVPQVVVSTIIQPQTGILHTQFSTPVGLQRNPVTSINSTAYGAHVLKPGNTGGWVTTRFGAAVPGLGLPVTGSQVTVFAQPFGGTHWNAASVGKVTKFSYWTAYYAFNQTFTPYSWKATKFGNPQVVSNPFQPVTQIVSADGFRSLHVGTPAFPHTEAVSVRGVSSTRFGTPQDNASRIWQVSSLSSMQHGAHSGRIVQAVSGATQTAYGTHSLTSVRRATGVVATVFGSPSSVPAKPVTGFSKTRFGTPKGFDPNARRVYTLFNPARFGQPRAYNQFRYPVPGTASTHLGVPDSTKTHRVTMIPPVTSFGKPLLKRSLLC